MANELQREIKRRMRPIRGKRPGFGFDGLGEIKGSPTLKGGERVRLMPYRSQKKSRVPPQFI